MPDDYYHVIIKSSPRKNPGASEVSDIMLKVYETLKVSITPNVAFLEHNINLGEFAHFVCNYKKGCLTKGINSLSHFSSIDLNQLQAFLSTFQDKDVLVLVPACVVSVRSQERNYAHNAVPRLLS